MNWIKHTTALWAIGLMISSLYAAREPAQSRENSEAANQAYRIQSLLRNAESLLKENQNERAEKLLESIPRLYPSNVARFEAHLMLGRFYQESRNTEKALKQFQAVTSSEAPEELAEAYYRIGICHFEVAAYNQAFSTLRKVTNEYPGSVYANESYYYIGLCHFQLKRWSQAVEALKKVGTSLNTEKQEVRLAESGQRLFIRLDDQDLIVNAREGGKQITLQVDSNQGDKETVTLEQLGQSGINYVGSVKTGTGVSTPGNHILEVRAGTEVSIHYIDDHTHSGERNVTRVAKVQMVSSAVIGFTDGAFRDYSEGIFVEQPFFIQIKDFDRDISDQPDTLTATVVVQYIEEEKDDEKSGVDLSSEVERIRTRSSTTVTLTETGPHTGIFVGGDQVMEQTEATQQTEMETRGILTARTGDQIVLEYTDNQHIQGDEPRDLRYTAKILTGNIQDVRIEHREVENDDLRARKNLIESKIFLKLGQVFKEVGLQKKAEEKADQGLDLAENVIRIGFKAGIDRKLVEEAFNSKWELLLVKNDLRGAISVCNQLIRLFPNSSLADHALMRIGMLRMEEDPREATQIFQSILRLPQSELKAEAQFRLAEIAEVSALKAFGRAQDRQPNMSAALKAYKTCADNYPDSPYAADSLEKISSYYIQVKDYARAIEMMEQVFQDYPDASFLDSMLFKWTVAAYRLGDFASAKEKVDRLLFNYPNSDYAEKAKKIQAIVVKKL